MKKQIIVSDFDGTITKIDSLAKFLEDIAGSQWLEIENDWKSGKIGSQDCLKKQFALINNLSPKLITNFLETIEIDKNFIDFCDFAKEKNIPIIILSDGLDYFINFFLNKYDITYPKVITNHAYFNNNNEFIIEFPNSTHACSNKAGTCKCNIVRQLKNEYAQIIYIGDGVSDFCASKETDILFAKSKLAEFCNKHCQKYNKFDSFKDISNYIQTQI